MMPFYLAFLATMKKAFPNEEVHLGFTFEGPFTTAYELRGETFFLDIMDCPELCQDFLKTITESIAGFRSFCMQYGGDAPFNDPSGCNLCDDIAAMIPPYLWKKMVVPAWNLYFNLTQCIRTVHVEDLREAQLPFLEDAEICYHDPSISPKINPHIIAKNNRVPFGWRLPGFLYSQMSGADVRNFVINAAAGGASTIFTNIEGIMCNDETARKIKIFIDTAEKAEKLLAGGCLRNCLATEL